MEKPKPVKVERVEEWKMEKILNKQKIQGIDKYLVHQKGFTAENNIQEKKEDLKNARELVDKFKRKLSTEVRRQKRIEEEWRIKLNPNAEKFRRSKLLRKYIAKILFRQDNRKFEDKYLKKLERNWQRWKSVSPEEKP